MTKEDFIKKFPDIKIQQFETETILSKQEIIDIVEQATRSMDMGLVYYEHCLPKLRKECNLLELSVG